MNMTIDLAQQFNPYPSGRFPADGSFNGQRFREEVLVPALKAVQSDANGKVVVNIDGVRTFGSSFLEEAFAGLVRKGLFNKRQLQEHLEVVCSKPHLMLFKDTIWSYIEEAKPEPVDPVHA